MAEITASMVKELREKTDAPMMECKKALTESNGDMAKAEEVLRVKLGNKATKAATRIAAEGIVAVDISADGKLGSIIEVNCETDFVAKNDDFLALVKGCAQLVSGKNPADVATLSALPMGEGTVESTVRARSSRPAPRWSARLARTCRSAASSASRPRANWFPTSMAVPRSAFWSIWLAATNSLARTSRCISPPRSRRRWTPRVFRRN